MARDWRQISKIDHFLYQNFKFEQFYFSYICHVLRTVYAVYFISPTSPKSI